MFFYLLVVIAISFCVGYFGGRVSNESKNISSPEVINALINEYNLLDETTNEVYPFLVFQPYSINTIIYSVNGGIIMTPAYAAVFYFGLAIFRRLKLEQGHMTEKTLNMHKQINQVLFIQVSTIQVNITTITLHCYFTLCLYFTITF